MSAILFQIPVFVQRRKNISLRRAVDVLLEDLRDGRLGRRSVANLFARHGLPLERALCLLVGRKA